MIIYIVIAVIGLFLLLAGVLGAYGSMLPATHDASASCEVDWPREKVWALVDDPAGFPSWCPGVDKVEMLPDRNGHRTFRQTQGRNSFVLEETKKEPPSLVTRTIVDDNNFFSGSWEHRFEDLGNGRTKVTVTETGTVNAAIPRAMMKMFFGYDMYLKKFCEALTAKCKG